MIETKFEAYRRFNEIGQTDTVSVEDAVVRIVKKYSPVTATELLGALGPWYGKGLVRQEVWRLIEAGRIKLSASRYLEW